MNAAGLLKHYERIADAPDAVAKLRRFILDLAVRGKLVAQLPKCELPAELPIQLPHEETGEFDLPIGWRRANFGAILVLQYGKGLKANDRATEGPIPVFGSNGIVGYTSEPLTVSPSIIVGRKGSAGALNLCDGPSWTTDVAYFVEVPSFFNARFLFNALASLNLEKLGKGVKPGLSRLDAYAQDLWVPPLAEQHLIVAKVDELMALCDQLEAARAEREARRDRLAAASLARLSAPDPETFHDDARFALDALPSLTARSDQIKQIRQTILRLAVRGALLPFGGGSSKPRRLGEVAKLQNGYAFKSEWFSKTGVRLVRNTNVGHGSLNWTDDARLPDAMSVDYERFKLDEGDVVLSLDRPFIATGTKVARIVEDDLPALLLQRVGRFVVSPELHPAYLFLWITSPDFAEQIDPGRSNGVPHISSKQVEAAVLLLPPLAAQLRIVTKVDELMALCDSLQASLDTGDTKRSSLLDALLHEALAPPELAEESE